MNKKSLIKITEAHFIFYNYFGFSSRTEACDFAFMSGFLSPISSKYPVLKLALILFHFSLHLDITASLAPPFFSFEKTSFASKMTWRAKKIDKIKKKTRAILINKLLFSSINSTNCMRWNKKIFFDGCPAPSMRARAIDALFDPALRHNSSPQELKTNVYCYCEILMDLKENYCKRSLF